MKRLFGLIGIVYLSTLTAVFYFKSVFIFCAAAGIAIFLIALGIYRRIKHNRCSFRSFVTAGASVLLAVLSIFLYQNYYINPIADNYSDKEISVEGYVCEEIRYNENSAEYLIQTTAINSNPVFTKLKYFGYSESGVNEFDRITLNAKAYAEDNDREISHRVLLRAYERTPGDIRSTGESVITPYKLAVTARRDFRKALGRLLPESSAELSRAILLGDKYALDDEVKRDFASTGTSYLIVVSGLHLSVATAIAMSVMKRFTKRRLVLSIGAIIAIICFCALTGFNYSVIRAAIMVIIFQAGRILLKSSDPLNSLGFAALAMTITNPCAVGDLGLLMSFSSTLGIILWSDTIMKFIVTQTRINRIPKKLLFQKRIKSALYMFSDIFSVSMAASLWIVPITIIAFGKISPMVVIISMITEPIASAILVMSLLCAVLYLFPVAPVITYLSALVVDMLCRATIYVNHLFAALPFSTVKADNAAVYIWLGITALLAVAGFLIKSKKNYMIFAVNTSFALMLILSAATMLASDKSTALTVYQSGGLCIEIRKENNISLIGTGGSGRYYGVISSDISESGGVLDNVIILPSNYNNSMLYDISKEYGIINLITDREFSEDVRRCASKAPYVPPDESMQTISLNSEAKDTLINTCGVMYQYIECNDFSALYVPRNSDISDLPEEFRAADYIILDGIARNSNLLEGDNLIYTGYKNAFSEEKIGEFKNQFKNITTLKENKYIIKART